MFFSFSIPEYRYLRTFSLSFRDDNLEQKYRKAYTERFIRSNRFSLLLGLLMYGIYTCLDYVISQPTFTVNLVRFGITIPLCVLIFALSFSKKIQHYSHVLYSILLLVVGLSFMYVFLFSSQELLSGSLLGILVLYIYSFNLIRIRFILTIYIMSFLYAICMLFIVFTFSHEHSEVLVILFFLSIGFVFSAYAAYFFEFSDRKSFVTQYELIQKNQAYHTLQNELEHIVEERTRQLQTLNTELEKAKAKAEEHNKIKSKFLTTISHEIRTPLTAIMGFSQLLLKNPEPEKRNMYYATIEENTNKLLEIVTNILSLAEIEIQRLEPAVCKISHTFFSRKIENVIQKKLQKYHKDLYFNIQFEERRNFMVTMGETDLLTIIKHIVDNAIKYTSVGQIGCACKINADNMFEILVSDNGTGIPLNQLTVIFEYFRQGNQDDSRTFQGIGAGLAICKGLVQNAGGSIFIESKEGKGTKTKVLIPILKK
ncbi:MAG: HAMP domain-containing sensor histidine kinase [Bacteroidales bacterium]|jgi:signal transduction histidine kinase|nr:HAMP domain-containing sensor histidine kinase [Bacteroidales bacterium]